MAANLADLVKVEVSKLQDEAVHGIYKAHVAEQVRGEISQLRDSTLDWLRSAVSESVRREIAPASDSIRVVMLQEMADFEERLLVLVKETRGMASVGEQLPQVLMDEVRCVRDLGESVMRDMDLIKANADNLVSAINERIGEMEKEVLNTCMLQATEWKAHMDGERRAHENTQAEFMTQNIQRLEREMQSVCGKAIDPLERHLQRLETELRELRAAQSQTPLPWQAQVQAQQLQAPLQPQGSVQLRPGFVVEHTGLSTARVASPPRFTSTARGASPPGLTSPRRQASVPLLAARPMVPSQPAQAPVSPKTMARIITGGRPFVVSPSRSLPQLDPAPPTVRFLVGTFTI